MLKPLRLILVEPNHPANIGATARAMKTMGIHSLYLVNPAFFPSPAANAMASNGIDILDHAVVVPSLPDALSDCQLIFATSARETAMDFPRLPLREAAHQAKHAEATGQQVAFIFGTERTGLTNEELKLCHYHVRIPTSDSFTSLNLAQAIQLVCYELLIAERTPHSIPTLSDPEYSPSAKFADTERFYIRLEMLLRKIGFLKPGHDKIILRKLRRLFQRAQLQENEVIILQGILSNINQHQK